jgi:hypothetical protein
MLLAPARDVPIGTHTYTHVCVPTTTPRARASSNESHSSNGFGEVIHARCYCDRAHLTVTEHSNRHGDVIGPLLLWYLCENIAPFTSLDKNRLSIESSLPDLPSARIGVPMGTRPCACANRDTMQAKGRPGGVENYNTSSIKSYCCGFLRWLMWSIVGKVGLMFECNWSDPQ